LLKRWTDLTIVSALLAFCLAMIGCVMSSPEATFVEAWVTRHGGQTNDYSCQVLALDSLDNVYVAGYSCGREEPCDYATTKYDCYGNQQWVARYDGPAGGDDRALDLAIDSMGSACVTGWSDGNGTDVDYATMKYDSGGRQLWVARYDGPASGTDLAYAVASDYSGNVYVTGASEGNETGTDCLTVKYDNDGHELWVARYDGPLSGKDASYAIAVDAWANVYVTGWSEGNGTKADYVTIKYDSDGNQMWVARYDSSASREDTAHAIAIDDWGNVFIAGSSEGHGTGADYATIKYDGNGNPLWVKRYNGPASSDDKAADVAVDIWGNVYVTGWSLDERTGADYATIKYDAAGNQMWVARYNGPSSGVDNAQAMGIDGRGNTYVSGWSKGKADNYDYATVKYDADGRQLRVARYNGPANGNDRAYALAVDALGSAYVTGRSPSDTDCYDCATVKYAH
jgi:hypothetical protein